MEGNILDKNKKYVGRIHLIESKFKNSEKSPDYIGSLYLNGLGERLYISLWIKEKQNIHSKPQQNKPFEVMVQNGKIRQY